MTPDDLKYSKTHEWARADGDVATVGITDHAQDTLGDITFVEPPKVGAALRKGGEAGVIESVKAASDLLSPVSGEVLSVNGALSSAPEAINSEPYGAGWLFTVKMTDKAELGTLMDAAAYNKFVETEG
ncbi:MAG: glycine cleavage system protein GcvH [Chitinispirillia bacterium]|nr:glycine cleavage system protein GcvH [Chitinispirillia bacterium]MCL2268134.1 glycine cleavage system protein GcvH [Chitinispirillia bacterium]